MIESLMIIPQEKQIAWPPSSRISGLLHPGHAKIVRRKFLVGGAGEFRRLAGFFRLGTLGGRLPEDPIFGGIFSYRADGCFDSQPR
jgi:hypothetical protein